MTQILVVDDSLSVRKALETILRPLAYTVRMADSAEAALSAMRAQSADLVIADVLMPGLSGFELCQQLKATPEFAHTPVVLISGIVSEEESAHARVVGAVGLVKKPFRADDLLPIVQNALSEEQRADTNAPSLPETGLPAPALAELLGTLLGKQGILGALVVGPSGEVVMARGEELPDLVTLGHYLRFFVSASEVFAARLGDQWHSALLEYGGRSLLLSSLGGGHALVVTLRDAGASTVAKFVVKGQREQFATALLN